MKKITIPVASSAYFVFIVLLLLTPVIVSCGGGSGNNDGDTTPIIPDKLPPDPGEAGKLTLEGIDSDSDKVRDDIQIAIAQRYPDEASKQIVLKQQAMALQDAVNAGDSVEQSEIDQAAESITRSVYCLFETMNDPLAEIGLLEAQLMNTPERATAYQKFNDSLKGQTFDNDFSDNPCQ